MANHSVNIRLGSKFSGVGISAALKGLKRLVRGATDFKSAFEMSVGAVRGLATKIGAVLSSAFRFETQTIQFKTLIGNIDEAKAHMADLKALGDTPPFSLDEFAKASRALMVMTDGVLGYKKSLEMIGDAAAATGRPIEEMSQAVGRLYAFIRDGQPLSKAVMQLRNMGVITPEVAQKLQDLQAAGKSNAEIWAEVEAQLGRYSGAMKEAEGTGEGLISAIKTRWDNIVRAFGQAFADAAKDGMGQMLDRMKELEESEALDEWADNAVDALEKVKDTATGVAESLGTIFGTLWKGVKGSLGTAMAFASGMDEAGKRGEGWFNFSHGAAVAKEYWNREVLGEKSPEEQAMEEEEAQRKAERRKARRRAREAAEAQRAEQERARIAESLAEGQKKKDVRDAEAAAKKKAEAEKKAAEAAAKEREKLDREAHQRRINDIRKEIEEQHKAATQQRSVAAAAESEFSKAFAMYRDADHAAAVIGEEKAYQSDLQKLHRDARRYGGRWRIDELSALMSAGDTQGVTDTLARWRKNKGFTPQVEAMVRASAAELTKTTAEESLRKIEKNTAHLGDKIEQLLAMKGGA